jgi:CMP-2-keto-3-deoxyoctulosonic acid synthetase
MTILIIVPARYRSTKFPGQPLIPITDRDKKQPLIEHTSRITAPVK